MEQAELAAIRARAEAELRKIPGVLGVGFGLKQVGGKSIDQAAFRIAVDRKKPAGEVPAGEMIPTEFEGIPTDVATVDEAIRITCDDRSIHRPLIGGIRITKFKPAPLPPNDFDAGTLGFFATLNGVSGPENVVLVSNAHVLSANGGAVGNTVYQPEWATVDGVTGMVVGSGPIGKVHAIHPEANINFTYPGEPADDYFVDCADAKLDICISSWCNTNCGVSYKNEIRDLNIAGNSRIEGVARVTAAELVPPAVYVVYKVGASTSRTKGKITAIAPTLLQGQRNALFIEPLEPDCDGIMQFAAEGDSGSAIVNEHNQLVGLLFAISRTQAGAAYACQIHPVLEALRITPVSTANPPVGPAGQARADAHGFFDGINETIPLRERLLATPLGKAIYNEVLEQRAEVVALVNHCRPVTVAWHRGKGPAFLAHGVENVRNPEHVVPREIEGIDRATLARRIATALAEQGSPELKRAMERWLPFVLDHVDEFDSLHDLVSRFEREPASA